MKTHKASATVRFGKIFFNKRILVAAIIGATATACGTEAQAAEPPKSAAVTAPAVAPAVAPADTTPAVPPAFLAQWQARGSGCKGGFNSDGTAIDKADVELVMPSEKEIKDAKVVSFALKVPAYKLDSENGNPKKSINFARQCSFRIALNVPANKKVVGFRTATTVSISKGKDVDLTVAEELKFGEKTVANKLIKIEPTEEVKGRSEAISMSSTDGTVTTASIKDQCGLQTLIGIDSTLLAIRKDNSNFVNIGFEGAKEIRFEVELADCPVQIKK